MPIGCNLDQYRSSSGIYHLGIISIKIYPLDNETSRVFYREMVSFSFLNN